MATLNFDCVHLKLINGNYECAVFARAYCLGNSSHYSCSTQVMKDTAFNEYMKTTKTERTHNHENLYQH